MSKSTVAFIHCQDYEQERVDAAVARALELVGPLSRLVAPGARVLLKVNLLVPASPERAITTHPAVVRALIRQVRAAGGVPLVGDCSARELSPNLGQYRDICANCGLLPMIEEEGAELVHLCAAGVEVENRHAHAFHRFTVARAVREADVLISVPKLKTHGLTMLTGAVKNLFGCLPGLHKGQAHLRAVDPEVFAQLLVDLAATIRPTLTVMDAIVGMEGSGPSHGQPRPLGAVLASADPIALDATACRLVGVDPADLLTCRLGAAQGLGTIRAEEIALLGDGLEERQVQDFKQSASQGMADRIGRLPRPLVVAVQNRLTARPAVNRARCQDCGICVEHCPAHALSSSASAPTVDYGRCIRCYCCTEVCPHGAMRLRQPWLVRRLFH